MKIAKWAAAAAAMSFALTATAQVRVASKNFTEQFVLAELYAQAFEAAGIKVERKINLGGTLIVHKALEEKQVDSPVPGPGVSVNARNIPMIPIAQSARPGFAANASAVSRSARHGDDGTASDTDAPTSQHESK